MVLSTGKNRWPFVPGEVPAKIDGSFYRQEPMAICTWQKRLVAGYCEPNSILSENDEFPS
jgi:hypothetical protein